MAVINPAQPMPTFKVVLVGDGQTGKTTYASRLVTGEIPRAYVPTLGVEVHPFRFYVRGSDGRRFPVCFNLWDTAGQERFGGLKDGYFIQANAALVFSNPRKTGKALVEDVKIRIRDVYRVSPNTVYYVVYSHMNECAEVEKFMPANTHNLVGECGVVSRANHNLLIPLLALARTLLGDPTLQHVEADPVHPPVVRADDVLAAMRASIETAKQEYQERLADLAAYQEAIRLAVDAPLHDEIGV